MSTVTKKPYKKIALVLSIAAIVIWSVLGTGASLAWFTDTSPELHNVINIAQFDLEVSYRFPDETTYQPFTETSEVFNDEELYEPGYTKVVYFCVKNNGTVPFDHQTAVIVRESIEGYTESRDPIHLEKFLQFGLVVNPDESALEQQVATREKAAALATEPLNVYHSTVSSLGAGDETYMALILHMPEEVGNDANYRGIPEPTVLLGIGVNATQQR